MKRILGRIYHFFYYRFLILKNPALFAKKIGVNVKGSLFLYGPTPGMFGSEPWLITLGDNVHIVSGTNFVNHDGGVLILRHKHPKLEITKPIEVGNNVYFGMNTTIMPGVKVGDNVIIGACSLVNKDIPSNSVYAGMPAKFIKTIDDYTLKCIDESLELGHLSAIEKDKALRQLFLKK